MKKVKNTDNPFLYSGTNLDQDITYKSLFEDSGASIVIVNKEGIYLFVNMKAASIIGRSVDEIVGKSMFEFLPEEKAKIYLERNKFFIEAGTTERYEDTFSLPTGTRTFLITDHVLKNKKGKGYAIESSSIDITDRKEAEELLHESEELYRLIAQNLPGTTVILYDNNLRFILVEGYLHPDFGFTTDQLKGKTLWEVLPKERAERLATIYKKALAGESQDSYISEFKDKIFSINAVPVRNNQNVITHGLLISHDITEQRKNEILIQENESKLRELNETKDKFFSIIAHDLKSPFNSILGLSNFIIEEIEENKIENLK
jgi:PAS domain S-box-containing protein